MANYNYDNVIISNLAVVAIKIERRIGVRPTGLTDAVNYTTVYFATDLTAPQKVLLDTLMVESGIDEIPTNMGNTIYTVDDFSDNRATLQASLSSLIFDVYPTMTGYEIHFKKALTTTEKNNLKTLYGGTLKLKQ